MTKRRLLLLCAWLCAAGCKSEPNEGKLMPKLAPPPEAPLPGDLHIAVEIDGVAAPAIDAARLRAVEPDFADDERRAWRLETLLGPAVAREGATVFASGAHDLSVELKPRTPEGLIAVILVSRRGDVIATMVDAQKPFPGFHGQGGRLGRPPSEQLPRVAKVQKLRVVSALPP